MNRTNPGGGGMTGATGDLTPDDSTDAFQPAETREVAGVEMREESAAHSDQSADRADTRIGGDDSEPEPDRF